MKLMLLLTWTPALGFLFFFASTTSNKMKLSYKYLTLICVILIKRNKISTIYFCPLKNIFFFSKRKTLSNYHQTNTKCSFGCIFPKLFFLYFCFYVNRFFFGDFLLSLNFFWLLFFMTRLYLLDTSVVFLLCFF